MNKTQEMRDKEFAVWLSELLGDRLQLLPRGDKPAEYAIVGSGRPYYCYLDEEPMEQYGVLIRAHDEIMDALKANSEHLGSFAKAGNIANMHIVMRMIRRHRGVQ
jgi:hypothetical protein